LEGVTIDQKPLKDHLEAVGHRDAFLFHLNFGGVHPFIDGNGRSGRLILNLMLMQAGYPPIDVNFSDRRKYYACFDSYYRDNDASPMVNMVGEYVKERLSQYLSLLQD